MYQLLPDRIDSFLEHYDRRKRGNGKPLAQQDSEREDDSSPVKRIVRWRDWNVGLQYLPWDRRHGKRLSCGYGHIRNTRGDDGMALDCYYRGDSPSLYVIDQLGKDGSFDEYKLMIGFSSSHTAEQTYRSLMPGWAFGGIKSVGLDWLRSRTTEKLLKADKGERCGKGWIKAGLQCNAGRFNRPGRFRQKKFNPLGAIADFAESTGKGEYDLNNPKTRTKVLKRIKEDMIEGIFDSPMAGGQKRRAIAAIRRLSDEETERAFKAGIKRGVSKSIRASGLRHTERGIEKSKKLLSEFGSNNPSVAADLKSRLQKQMETRERLAKKSDTSREDGRKKKPEGPPRPCGKGWQGTKPPGCTRGRSLGAKLAEPTTAQKKKQQTPPKTSPKASTSPGSSAGQKKSASSPYDSPSTALKKGERIEGTGINKGATHKVFDPPPKEFGGEILNPRTSDRLGLSWVGTSRISNLPQLGKEWDSKSAKSKIEDLEDTFQHLGALSVDNVRRSNSKADPDLADRYVRSANKAATDLFGRMSDADRDTWAKSLKEPLDWNTKNSSAIAGIQKDINGRFQKLEERRATESREKAQKSKPKAKPPDDDDDDLSSLSELIESRRSKPKSKPPDDDDDLSSLSDLLN